MELEAVDERRVGEPLQPPLRRRNGAARVEMAVQLARENVAQTRYKCEHVEVEAVGLERARCGDARPGAHALREVHLDELAEAFARARGKRRESRRSLHRCAARGRTSHRLLLANADVPRSAPPSTRTRGVTGCTSSRAVVRKLGHELLLRGLPVRLA